MDIEAQPFDLRECVESALDLVSARAAEKHLDIAYVFEGDVPRGGQRRRDAAAPDPAQPAVQRGQVHRARRGRAHRDARRRGRRQRRAHLRRARHRHRPLGRRHGPAVPVVLAGRLVDHAQVRRHRARPGDQQAPGRADGRHACGRESDGPGHGLDVLASRSTRRVARAAAEPRARDFVGAQPELQGKRVLVVDDNATNRRVLALQTGQVGHACRATPSRPREALRWLDGGERFDLAILDMHMPEMDGLALARRDPRAPARRCRSCCSARSAGARPATTDGLFAAYLAQAAPPVAAVRHAGRTCSRATPRPRPPPRRQGRSSTPSMAARHPLRILLAEDNVVNQKLALRLLQQMGYRADLASQRHRGGRVGASARPTTWC